MSSSSSSLLRLRLDRGTGSCRGVGLLSAFSSLVKSMTSTFGSLKPPVACFCGVGRTDTGLEAALDTGAYAGGALGRGTCTCGEPSAGNLGPIDIKLGLLAEPGAVRNRAISCLRSGTVGAFGTPGSSCLLDARVSPLLPLARGSCDALLGLNVADAGGSELVAGGTEGLFCSSQERWSPRLLRVICGEQHCSSIVAWVSGSNEPFRYRANGGVVSTRTRREAEVVPAEVMPERNSPQRASKTGHVKRYPTS